MGNKVDRQVRAACATPLLLRPSRLIEREQHTRCSVLIVQRAGKICRCSQGAADPLQTTGRNSRTQLDCTFLRQI